MGHHEGLSVGDRRWCGRCCIHWRLLARTCAAISWPWEGVNRGEIGQGGSNWVLRAQYTPKCPIQISSQVPDLNPAHACVMEMAQPAELAQGA